MITDFLTGTRYFLHGFKLVSRPELRKFVIIPLAVNTIVFIAAIWTGIYQFETLLDFMLPQGDAWWAEAVRAVLWILFAVIALLVLVFTFSLLANFIAAPFNGLLAEKVETYLSGTPIQDAGGFREFLLSIVPSLWSEIKKILYYVFYGALVFIFLLLPIVHVLSPFVWVVFTSWMLALEYVAYPIENRNLFFTEVRRQVKQHKLISLGFGAGVMLAAAVPVVNFLVMPAAVAGATAMWVERFRRPAGQ